MMDPDLKKKWVKALRSGRYLQQSSTLYFHTVTGEDRFCCLGVLCNIVQPEFDHDVFVTEGGSVMGYPRSEVYSRAGLKIGEMKMLAAMNDRGASFRVIADVIENQL
jgi:hypothetical protein